MSQPDIMTLEEVAKYLRVSERTVYEWAQKGEIPCGKLGTSWRFKRSEVEHWVDRRLSANKAGKSPISLSLKSVLTPERIRILNCSTKHDALQEMIDLLASAPEVRNRDQLAQEIIRREELMSTGIGFGIGFPHVRLSTVDNIVMAMGVNQTPIEDYESLDGKPVQIICMIAAASDQHTKHIKLLAAISRLLKQDAIRQQLLHAKNEADIFAIIMGEQNP